MLKNTLDWVSRSDHGTPDLSAFEGRVAALLSASPGSMGGLRGLVHLRAILSNIGTIVVPNQLTVPNAASAFDESGCLVDDAQSDMLQHMLITLMDMGHRLSKDNP